MEHLIIHARLTKACNADCSYCSSFQENPHKRMSPESFRKAIGFIRGLIEEGRLGGKRDRCEVQYVGGEILLIPKEELREIVACARETIKPLFRGFADGCQSNLMGSEERVDFLFELFGRRVGTSIDQKTGQRKLAGSAEKYDKMFAERDMGIFRKTGRRAPAILAIDRKMAPWALDQIKEANRNARPLTLRPVFQGGSAIEPMGTEELALLYRELFNAWFMKMGITIQPFGMLLARRLDRFRKESRGASFSGGCPFQANCAQSSINLEPNGDLSVCLDMADAGQLNLGNALRGEFDREMWEEFKTRPEKLDASCKSCAYLNECKGGCASEGMAATGSMHGKTELCGVWKAVFGAIDEGIARESAAKVEAWLNRMERQESPES